MPEVYAGSAPKCRDRSGRELVTYASEAGVTVKSSGDVSVPVRVKLADAVSFDADYRGARGTTNPPHGHWRCNSSSRAPWASHPVCGVFRP